MNLSKVTSNANAPGEYNVLIEISASAGPIKYEFDKASECMIVDRFMSTSMSYPCNYGFIPHTLSGDGDPIDVLVYTSYPIIPGTIISVKPIGVLITEDEKGPDEKVLAIPGNKIDPLFASVNSLNDLSPMLLDKVKHFFESYKALEKGKWVKVTGWEDAQAARDLITKAIENYNISN